MEKEKINESGLPLCPKCNEYACQCLNLNSPKEKLSIEERLYKLSKIIEDSIEGKWTGIIHTKWVEEVRDIIKQVRQETKEEIKKQL